MPPFPHTFHSFNMEHSPRYYEDKMAEYTAWAETTAQKLYKDAIAGTISYAKAWYGLPGPPPIVNTFYGQCNIPNGAQMGPCGTAYVAHYRFLPATDTAFLKIRFDEEMRKHTIQRGEDSASLVRHDEETVKSLKAQLDKTRDNADLFLAASARREAQITELRKTLAACEEAYARELKEVEQVQATKDAAESAYQTYLRERDSKMEATRIEIDARDRILIELREIGVARQTKEDADLAALAAERDAASKREQAEAKRMAEDIARVNLAVSERREFEKRIEEEVQRRTKDLEFERLVRERMNQLRE
jgi:hypothetical protein